MARRGGGRRKKKTGSPAHSDFDVETIKLCRKALDDADITQLRALACERGLVNGQLRRRCWPVLLGLEPGTAAGESGLGHSRRTSTETPPSISEATGTAAGQCSRRISMDVQCSAAGGRDYSSRRSSREGQSSGTTAGSAGPGSSSRSCSREVKDRQHVLGVEAAVRRKSSRRVSMDVQPAVPLEAGSTAGPQRSRSDTTGLQVTPSAGEEEAGTECSCNGSLSGEAHQGACLEERYGSHHSSAEQYERWHTAQHRDSQVVVVDVERSLWSFTPGMGEDERQVLRDQLRRLLNAVVGRYADLEPSQQVHYYQGLHDVASVLLMELGEEASAFTLLSCLVRGHLRDCTRPNLEPVLELLQLIYPLLGYVDPALGQALRAQGLPPYFALSWLITWFAHDVKTLKTAARLFDVFLSTHPLMPMYLGVVAMASMRAPLLACTEMPELHALLSHLDLLGEGMPPLGQLLGRAMGLMRKMPPSALLARVGREAAPLTLCVSPWAELQGSCWVLPHAPGRMRQPRGHINGLQLLLSNVPSWLRLSRGESGLDLDEIDAYGLGRAEGKKRPRSAPIVALSVGGMLSVYVVAVLVGYAALRAGPSGGLQ